MSSDKSKPFGNVKSSIREMLRGLHASEGKGLFTDFGSADEATYNGITFSTMQASDDPAFNKISKDQMRAMGGVVYFAPEFKKEYGKEIDIKNKDDLAKYNVWVAEKTKRKLAPLEMATVETLSEDNINNFYVKNYFNKAKISEIKDVGLQYILFDMSVNFGIGSAKENNGMMGILSRTLSKKFPDATGDNVFEKANSVDAKELIRAISEERMVTYNNIIKRNPAKEQFRESWTNRTRRVAEDAINGNISVADYSKNNKTYGVNGVADSSFFDTDSGFWQSLLKALKQVVYAVLGIESKDSTPPQNVAKTLASSSATRGV